MWRDDAYLLDILIAGRKILKFAHGVSWEQFQEDEVLQNASMRLIQIIGEAARKVSEEYKQAHPEIPWQQMVGMRHRLVHEYFRIIPELVWDVIENHIPGLVSLVEPLVPPEES